MSQCKRLKYSNPLALWWWTDPQNEFSLRAKYDFDYEEFDSVSPEAKDFISRLLRKRADDRINSARFSRKFPKCLPLVWKINPHLLVIGSGSGALNIPGWWSPLVETSSGWRTSGGFLRGCAIAINAYHRHHHWHPDHHHDQTRRKVQNVGRVLRAINVLRKVSEEAARCKHHFYHFPRSVQWG